MSIKNYKTKLQSFQTSPSNSKSNFMWRKVKLATQSLALHKCSELKSDNKTKIIDVLRCIHS